MIDLVILGSCISIFAALYRSQAAGPEKNQITDGEMRLYSYQRKCDRTNKKMICSCLKSVRPIFFVCTLFQNFRAKTNMNKCAIKSLVLLYDGTDPPWGHRMIKFGGCMYPRCFLPSSIILPCFLDRHHEFFVR
jgi:hypothetical protein